MSVAYELKQKRAALTDRRQQLERERVDIQELMRALDRVILSYESDYKASALTGSEQGNRSRKARRSSSEVKAAMNGVNKRQAVLEVLREAGEPISVTDCAAKFAVVGAFFPEAHWGLISKLEFTFRQMRNVLRVDAYVP